MLAVNQSAAVWQIWVLGLIELLINKALESDLQAAQLIHPYIGRVVRIKTEDPHCVIFVILAQSGIQLYHQFDGGVDVRAEVSAKLLAGFLLGAETKETILSHIQVIGDFEVVQKFFFLLDRLQLSKSLVGILQEFFPRQYKKNDMIKALIANDVSLLETIHALPEWFGVVSKEMQLSRKTQEMFVDTLQEVKQLLHQQKKKKVKIRLLGVFLLIFSVVFMVAELSQWKLLISQATVFLFSLGWLLLLL